ncbi:conserved exported hypothetical protein [Rubrivivax sp. A210]|uniref:hypothetical protein n=1 Tax=Rubrivivax sp. A210 TaxID=2772301 RepID=UPI001918431F|nr:hypothetical protein [Rubrivivax sp. A210]CAD5369649.1 conserved exported hypothetical protein [Rubrivivax sp. A210]
MIADRPGPSRPCPQGRPHLTALATAFCGLLATLPVQAATYNVAPSVTGQSELMPPALLAEMPCGGACSYTTASTVAMDDGYTLTPGGPRAKAWPTAFTTSMPAIGAVAEELVSWAGYGGATLDGGNVGVRQRAAVDFDGVNYVGAAPRRTSVQSWRSGSGFSTTSVAVRLNVPASGPMRTFVQFTVPTLVRQGQNASYVGGPSQFQTIQTAAARLQGRAAVDVMVDGLPVWSSASHVLLPQRIRTVDKQAFELHWDMPLGSDKVTLYLGSLPAGSRHVVAVVVRSELRVDAQTCHADSEFGVSYLRCHSRIEGLTLPSVQVAGPIVSFHVPDIRIFSR